MDKEFRSVVPLTLIGEVNRDALELEDEIVSNKTKFYVNDVNQVKIVDPSPVNNADMAMLDMLARGIDNTAPTVPGTVSKDPTAREVVIAEEKLQELKSIHQEFMADLWRQKYYLRLANIQLNYPQPREIIDEKGKKKTIYRTFLIADTILNEQSGERGILAIQFKTRTKANKAEIEREISVEEEIMKQKGINYKKLVIDKGYLDNTTYQMEVIPESLHKTSLATMQKSIIEEVQLALNAFPEIFIANQEEYFTRFSKAYNGKPQAMLEKFNQTKQQGQPAQGAQGGAPAGGSPALPV